MGDIRNRNTKRFNRPFRKSTPQPDTSKLSAIPPQPTETYLYNLTNWYIYYIDMIKTNTYDNDLILYKNDPKLSVVLLGKVFEDTNMTLNFAMLKYTIDIDVSYKTFNIYINISFMPTIDHPNTYPDLTDVTETNITEIISKYDQVTKSSWFKYTVNLNEAITYGSFGVGYMGWVHPLTLSTCVTSNYEPVLYTKDVREVYFYVWMIIEYYNMYTNTYSKQEKLDLLTPSNMRNTFGIFGGLLNSIKNLIPTYNYIMFGNVNDSNHPRNHIDTIVEISKDYKRRYTFTYGAPTSSTTQYKGYPPTDLTEPMVQYYMKACKIMEDYPNNPQELIDAYKATRPNIKIPTLKETPPPEIPTLKETTTEIPTLKETSSKRYSRKRPIGKPIDKTS